VCLLGAAFTASLLLAPRHGLFWRGLRRRSALQRWRAQRATP
jgi:hypothetical protein